MIPIYKEIYIGSEEDYYSSKGTFDYVIHACKEPFHRQLLGYTGRSAPKDHPEYLIAYRPKELFLNLVDADTSKYIPKEIIDAALEEIYKHKDEKILVHCNRGESRSATLGYLFLKKYMDAHITTTDYKKIYPFFSPAKGMREIIEIYA